MPVDPAQALRHTRRWVERAVVGLNLCPFAKAVLVKGQLQIAVTAASDWHALLADLEREVDELLACTPEQRDTTLLVAPDALPDFFEFHGFVAEAERLLARRELEGVLQLAHFHPRFEFAGEDPEAVTHFSNRSPYPTLHLLREDSIARAVQAFPDPRAIYEANMATLERLGPAGWSALMTDEEAA